MYFRNVYIHQKNKLRFPEFSISELFQIKQMTVRRRLMTPSKLICRRRSHTFSISHTNKFCFCKQCEINRTGHQLKEPFSLFLYVIDDSALFRDMSRQSRALLSHIILCTSIREDSVSSATPSSLILHTFGKILIFRSTKTFTGKNSPNEFGHF